jgi:excisionase family DNA binding protein
MGDITMERRAYRPDELALALGVGRSTVWKWIQEGRLTRIKVGRVTLIPMESVNSWIEHGLQEGQHTEMAASN